VVWTPLKWPEALSSFGTTGRGRLFSCAWALSASSFWWWTLGVTAAGASAPANAQGKKAEVRATYALAGVGGGEPQWRQRPYVTRTNSTIAGGACVGQPLNVTPVALSGALARLEFSSLGALLAEAQPTQVADEPKGQQSRPVKERVTHQGVYIINHSPVILFIPMHMCAGKTKTSEMSGARTSRRLPRRSHQCFHLKHHHYCPRIEQKIVRPVQGLD